MFDISHGDVGGVQPPFRLSVSSVRRFELGQSIQLRETRQHYRFGVTMLFKCESNELALSEVTGLILASDYL